MTGEVDGFSTHRQKGEVFGCMVKKGDSVTYLPVGCDKSTGSTAEETAEYLKTTIRIIASLTAGLYLFFT